MELALLILVGLVFTVVGFICVLTVVIQLPGVWMILALAVIIEVLDTLYLPEDRATTFGWWLLGGCTLLAVIGEIIEFGAGALGAKHGGSSRRGMIGAPHRRDRRSHSGHRHSHPHRRLADRGGAGDVRRRRHR